MTENERILFNNDSPIVVSDTTGIFKRHPKPESSATHDGGFGQSTKGYTVHDKSPGNKDNYRPASLVFPSCTVTIPPNAQSFQITYPLGSGTKILVSWSEIGDCDGDAGDITFGPGFLSSGNKITLALTLTDMYWSMNGGVPKPVRANGGTLVTIHYCPDGECTNAVAGNPCP